MHAVPHSLLEHFLKILGDIHSLSTDHSAPLLLDMLPGLLYVSVPQPSQPSSALIRQGPQKSSPHTLPREGCSQLKAACLQGKDVGQGEVGEEHVVENLQREE